LAVRGVVKPIGTALGLSHGDIWQTALVNGC
jgi:hypothetical protein